MAKQPNPHSSEQPKSGTQTFGRSQPPQASDEQPKEFDPQADQFAAINLTPGTKEASFALAVSAVRWNALHQRMTYSYSYDEIASVLDHVARWMRELGKLDEAQRVEMKLMREDTKRE